MHTIGNHEVEFGDINAKINSTSLSFSYPSNYPFHSYSNRYPVPVSMQYNSMAVSIKSDASTDFAFV